MDDNATNGQAKYTVGETVLGGVVLVVWVGLILTAAGVGFVLSKIIDREPKAL